MEQLSSDTCKNRRAMRLVGGRAVLGLCQATAVAQFHVHVILQLLIIRSLQ